MTATPKLAPSRARGAWVRRACVAAAFVGVTAACSIALAGEGGSSVYSPGTYDDFAAAVSGPAGLYLRNDTIITHSSIGARPLGGGIDAGAEQLVWTNLAKFGWTSRFKLLGGTYAAGFILPIVPYVRLEGRVSGPGFDVFRDGATGGMADLYVVPAQIRWAIASHYIVLGLGVSMPTGKYAVGQVLVLGRNYWGFDPTLSYTYLNRLGFDVSVTTGVLFNTENRDTRYTTGFEYHLDWLAGWHFSRYAGLAAVGYWYEQITDDRGNIPPQVEPGFRGRGVGVGPAVLVNAKLVGHEMSFIAKWIHDVEVKHRFKGDIVMLSIALAL